MRAQQAEEILDFIEDVAYIEDNELNAEMKHLAPTIDFHNACISDYGRSFVYQGLFIISLLMVFKFDYSFIPMGIQFVIPSADPSRKLSNVPSLKPTSIIIFFHIFFFLFFIVFFENLTTKNLKNGQQPKKYSFIKSTCLAKRNKT